jgi:hypothetical protein
MTKGKAMVHSNGQMVDSILVNGRKESNMEKERILVKMEREELASGSMAGNTNGMNDHVTNKLVNIQ